MNKEKFTEIVDSLLSLQVKTYVAESVKRQIKTRGWHEESLRLAPHPRQALCEICQHWVEDRPMLIDIRLRQRFCGQASRKCPIKRTLRQQLGKY